MKEFQLYGLGNALVDIFIDVPDADFAALGFERGSMRLVGPDEQNALLGRFQGRERRLVSGGSVANSVIAFSQLGGEAAFLGCVGDDRYGLFYKTEFDELGGRRGRNRGAAGRARDDDGQRAPGARSSACSVRSSVLTIAAVLFAGSDGGAAADIVAEIAAMSTPIPGQAGHRACGVHQQQPIEQHGDVGELSIGPIQLWDCC